MKGEGKVAMEPFFSAQALYQGPCSSKPGKASDTVMVYVAGRKLFRPLMFQYRESSFGREDIF
jgi:hypothetical protein